MKKKTLLMTGAGVLLLAATAGASVLVYDQINEDETSQQASGESVSWNSNRVASQQPAPAPQPACDDDNIVGKVVGGVGGGVLGSQFGKGNGKTAATIGGSVGGTLLGEEYLPTRNVTCR